MERIDATRFASNEGAALTLLYGCTIFLSAFLLFQVQPLIGKMLLPWFGGSAAVWSTCLLFFQLLLLLGYLYAHWISSWLTSKKQGLVHISLLALSIMMLPIMPNSTWKPMGSEDPTLLIIGLMAMTIGLPYFLLSTTGPLLQAWFAREKPGAVPYRLFALSNSGSMLGLLSYPLVFEPRLSMSDMSVAWSATYVVFTLLCAMLAWRCLRVHGAAHGHAAVNESERERERGRPSASRLMLWVVLAACPAVLLMAVTSHLTQNVAPVPFLWVLPLALYLMSFILCFESGKWYRRIWYLPLFIAWVGVMNVDLLNRIGESGEYAVWMSIALYCGGLFVSCMLCHGELAKTKPHPAHLTSFYLMIALGGALGGILVAIIAPHFFNNNYELPLGAIVTALVIVTRVHQEVLRSRSDRPGKRLQLTATTAMALAVALVAILAAIGTARKNDGYQVLVRNFYGTLSVADSDDDGHIERQLSHGAILHGTQYLETARRRWPTTYYGDNSGAGMAVLATRHNGQQQRVGVIGLGAGTMAAYGRAGDYYRFYEINPLVVQLARSEFTFLSDSPAVVETAMGDARLSLEREQGQRFDVLVVDAFSGDSIPVHLLTREAFAVYFRHMKPDGILAVHISNHNLDLAPVVKHASDYYRKEARLVESDDDDSRGLIGSTWMLISDHANVFNAGTLKGNATTIDPVPGMRPWTDDYSSIYTILK
jgi:SAM-dependent methyltransferase